jgi:hypothetical protein
MQTHKYQSNSIRASNILVKEFEKLIQIPIDKDKAKNEFKKQVEYEANYLEKTRLCHTNGDGSILGISIRNISSINKKNILHALRTKFFDPVFMDEVRCMINTIIDMSDDDEESERARIHEFINKPKRFGTPSSYGFALMTDLKTSQDKGYDLYNGEMVVVKCPREPSNAKELIHELVVGVELSKLRKYGCCGFSYVYDAFYCGAPIVNDKTNEVISWCMNSNNSVSYVIYENIQNSKPIKSLVKDYSDKSCLNFIKYMTQIALYEYLAEIKCGFCHHDAHNDNILLRHYHDKEFYIPCIFDDKTVYVPSPGSIATFIDYGMSTITTEDGIRVGKLDISGRNNALGISANYAAAISDIHKLLCFMLRDSIYANNLPLTECISGILGSYFYGQDDMTIDECNIIVEKQSKSYYYINQNIIEKTDWNMRSFIKSLYNYSREKYGLDNMLLEPPSDALIFGKIDLSPVPIINQEIIKLEIPEVPSLFDLYQSPDNEEIKQNIIKNIIEVINKERSIITPALTSSDGIAFIQFYDKNRERITEMLDIITISMDSFASVIDNLYILKEKLKVYDIVETTLSTPFLTKLYNECKTKHDKLSHYIENIKPVLIKNFNRLKHILSDTFKKSKINNFINNKINNLKPEEITEYKRICKSNECVFNDLEKALTKDEIDKFMEKYDDYTESEKYGEDTLYNLYDKYNNIVSTITV